MQDAAATQLTRELLAAVTDAVEAASVGDSCLRALALSCCETLVRRDGADGSGIDLGTGQARGDVVTPLLEAVKAGDEPLVMLLLRSRAFAPGTARGAPVAVAVARRHDGVLRLLLSAALPVTSPDPLGWTPLHHALRQDRPLDFLADLLVRGADPNASVAVRCPNTLCWSTQACALELAPNDAAFRLLLAAGATARPSALHCVARAGQLWRVRAWLAAAGAAGDNNLLRDCATRAMLVSLGTFELWRAADTLEEGPEWGERDDAIQAEGVPTTPGGAICDALLAAGADLEASMALEEHSTTPTTAWLRASRAPPASVEWVARAAAARRLHPPRLDDALRVAASAACPRVVATCVAAGGRMAVAHAAHAARCVLESLSDRTPEDAARLLATADALEGAPVGWRAAGRAYRDAFVAQAALDAATAAAKASAAAARLADCEAAQAGDAHALLRVACVALESCDGIASRVAMDALFPTHPRGHYTSPVCDTPPPPRLGKRLREDRENVRHWKLMSDGYAAQAQEHAAFAAACDARPPPPLQPLPETSHRGDDDSTSDGAAADDAVAVVACACGGECVPLPPAAVASSLVLRRLVGDGAAAQPGGDDGGAVLHVPLSFDAHTVRAFAAAAGAVADGHTGGFHALVAAAAGLPASEGRCHRVGAASSRSSPPRDSRLLRALLRVLVLADFLDAPRVLRTAVDAVADELD